MLQIQEYQQTAVYDPTDPNQVIREVYTPGGYSSFYFNRVPTTAQLAGLRGLGAWSTLPSWAQIGIVGLASAGVGFVAMKKWGSSHIKPALRKVGIPLSGGRRRRR